MEERKVKNIFLKGAISPSHIAENIAAHQEKVHIGGHSIFLGQVRADVIDSRKVSAIEYTSYEDMALQKMHEIREQAIKKYDLSCMHVYHSLGNVKAGEICLFVFTSSAHRHSAISACSEVVELIKKELPIWGKEVFEDESYKWKENR